MAAQSLEEVQRRRRRQRLVRGLVIGAAAVGVPAALNWMVSRRAGRLPVARWGTGDRWKWRHGRVAFQRLGDGPPLVLLHSLGPGHGSGQWRRSAEVLAPDFELFAPDLLGWGASERPAIAYRPGLYVDLIGDFLATVVRRPATVVAAGHAAAYAVEVALARPDLVPALGLVVPRGIEARGERVGWRDRVAYGLLRVPILGTSAINVATRRAAISTHLRRDVFSSPVAVDDTLVEEHYGSSHLPGGHAALAAYLTGLLEHGVRDAATRLSTPLWLAWGRHAAGPPVEDADLWLKAVPHAELDVFEQCGTLPHAESPDEFARKLTTFLAGLPG